MQAADTPVRKTFTLHAEPDNWQQPYIAIAAEDRPDPGLYLGLRLGDTVHETLLERARLNPVALADRWRALNRLRVHVVQRAAAPFLALHDCDREIARVGVTPRAPGEALASVLRKTASHLKKSVMHDVGSPFDFYEPFLHYKHSTERPESLDFGMKFFDGATRYVTLEERSSHWRDHRSAIDRWDPAICTYEPWLVRKDDTHDTYQVDIQDQTGCVVGSVAYDGSTPSARSASQTSVMLALRDLYAAYRNPVPAAGRLKLS